MHVRRVRPHDIHAVVEERGDVTAFLLHVKESPESRIASIQGGKTRP